MEKLKTLKDIYSGPQMDRFISIGDLKQEAIKWVKDIIFRHNLSHIDLYPTSYQEGTSWVDYDERIIWIKHFFNLTEEDLK
jgi:hypothetical protein